VVPVFFTESKEIRDKCCTSKDKVIEPILRSLPIPSPKQFHAITMPCLFGKEIYVLIERGVLISNIWAIERDPKSHAILANPEQDLEKYGHLVGIKTTPKPLSAEKALNCIWADEIQFDLIYLDFFGRYYDIHLKSIETIFGLKMLKESGTLIMTFGDTRCPTDVAELQRLLGDIHPAEAIIARMAQKYDYPLGSIEERKYLSTEGNNRDITYHKIVARGFNKQ
jgi:hypothetical protein